jgi:diacylglycerol kinase (ATP)
MQFIARRLGSFRYAFAGIGHVIRTQRNAWIHAVISLSVIGIGAWLRLARIEWALIALAMGVVWAAEIINTALEALVDLAAPEPHPRARIAKDCAAAAVLVTAIMAVVIGLLVLGPPLWEKVGL